MGIRRAAPGHLPILLQLVAASRAEADCSFVSVEVAEAIGPLLQDDRFGVAYLIEAESTIVGYGIVTWGWSIRAGGRTAALDEVYLGPAHHSLAPAAIADIMTDQRSRGISSVGACVAVHRSRRSELLLGAGFVPSGSVLLTGQN